MSEMLISMLSTLLIGLGCGFCLTGALGLLRMPNFITRTHAASLIDSLGAILILSGLILEAGLSLITVKLLFILAFLLLTGPTAVHALVNTALNEEPKKISEED
jgi:multicomponent Na+:H+ antiporter subunit G